MGRPKGHKLSPESRRKISVSTKRAMYRPEVQAKLRAPKRHRVSIVRKKQLFSHPALQRFAIRHSSPPPKPPNPWTKLRPKLRRKTDPFALPRSPNEPQWYAIYEGRVEDANLYRVDAFKPDTDRDVLLTLSRSFEILPGVERHVRGPRPNMWFPTIVTRTKLDPPPILVGTLPATP